MSQPTATATALPPLEMNVTVPLTPAEAFELFTRDIGAWWPLATHSVCGADAATCAFEGGELVETSRDGSRHVWGRVLAWEPPTRVTLTWHPGREEASGQELELRFVGAGDGCRVELEHSGWERLGPAADAVRTGYAGGWQHVIGTLYRRAAEARGSSRRPAL
jgi:uncharacterized protein YndB with AHSA1/START domain